MDCVHCGSSSWIKYGIAQGRQRYRCKVCGHRYTVERKSSAFSASVKQQALKLYLEGMGFRAISRVLGMSHVSVYRWIKAMGQQADPLPSHSAIDVVEMDELHTYIGNKKTTAGSGLP